MVRPVSADWEPAEIDAIRERVARLCDRLDIDGETTPIADQLGGIPSLPMDRRVRSADCAQGAAGCEEASCACTCHDLGLCDPTDAELDRVLAGLDTIINQGLGTFSGFEVVSKPAGERIPWVTPKVPDGVEGRQVADLPEVTDGPM
jgi:hypothetical protein